MELSTYAVSWMKSGCMHSPHLGQGAQNAGRPMQAWQPVMRNPGMKNKAVCADSWIGPAPALFTEYLPILGGLGPCRLSAIIVAMPGTHVVYLILGVIFSVAFDRHCGYLSRLLDRVRLLICLRGQIC